MKRKKSNEGKEERKGVKERARRVNLRKQQRREKR